MSSKALPEYSGLKAFLDTHCHSSQYVFQIKKCADFSSYQFCQLHSPSMGTQLGMVSFLPLPLLGASKEHYLPFSALYGEIPNEKDLPSHQTTGDAEAVAADAKHKPLFVSSKVYMLFKCEECFKVGAFMHYTSFSGSRRLFCKICMMRNCTLVALHSFHLIHSLLALLWCGNINCSTPMECQYCSLKLTTFPPVCYYCGISEETFVEDAETEQLRQEYAVVRLLCFPCKSEEKTPYVKMPMNVRKRRRLE